MYDKERRGSMTDDLERLLRRRNENTSPIIVDEIEHKTPKRTVAEKSATIDDFITMLSKIVCRTMKDEKVEFRPDEGIRLQVDQAEPLDHPYIFFSILDSRTTLEIKPRVREVGLKGIDGQEKEKRRSGEVWGQLFNYSVQFDILAGDYSTVTRVMNTFEDIVFSYTAYFKRKGVKDIRFRERATDRNLDAYRQKCSVRSLRYEIEVEALFARLNANIEGVDLV